jgi:hypothetical protein
MSGLSMDFETLTKETIELTQNLNFDFEKFDDEFSKNHSSRFINREESNLIDFSDSEEDTSQIPLNCTYQGPGVVYLIEKGISTFCIRGIATDDLAWEQDQLETQNSDFLKQFRVSSENLEQCNSIRFFETPSEEIAQGIIKTMMNRRFPIAEASLCNLSDPGFSWWMDQGETEINIYFQSHSIDRDKLLIQLGPLGDSNLATTMMQKASSTLKHFFPIKEYSITPRSMSISCCDTGIEGFSELARLFAEGDFCWEEILSMGSGQHFEVLEYLHQLSFKRRFWKLVSES